MLKTLTQKYVQGNVNLNMKVGLCGCMQIVTHGLAIEILPICLAISVWNARAVSCNKTCF